MKKWSLVWVVAAHILSGCMAVDVPRSSNTPEMERTVKPTIEEAALGRAKASTELAAGWYQRAQYATALEELGNAVKAVPEHAPALGVYGLVHHAMKEDAVADGYFKRAIARTPADGDLQHNYGWFLCRTNREVESVAHYEAAASNPLYRTPDLALHSGAQCAARAKKMQIAERLYRQMNAIAPDSPLPHFGLSELTYKVGRYADARTHLRDAMRTPQVPASILYLGVCTEIRLGDKNAENAYLSQLKNRFPGAVETARASNGDCD